MTWEDAPSHICRGGDKRGLAFCCPPVKPCPILNALDEVNLTPQEYIDIKTEFAKETKLGEGTGTCFGSLVWCCKPSKPCPLRDITLKNIGMTHDEYLDLKKAPHRSGEPIPIIFLLTAARQSAPNQYPTAHIKPQSVRHFLP